MTRPRSCASNWTLSRLKSIKMAQRGIAQYRDSFTVSFPESSFLIAYVPEAEMSNIHNF